MIHPKHRITRLIPTLIRQYTKKAKYQTATLRWSH